MKNLRGIWRLFKFTIVAICQVGSLLFVSALKGRNMDRSMRLRMGWAKYMLNLLGVEIELINQPPNGGYLYLANHRTYVDAPVICKHVFASIVAKAEVGKWPLVGAGIKATYTILVQRNSKESRKRTRKAVRGLLERDYSVIIFPEGTTSAGPGILPFRPGPFQIAEYGNFPVVPVALEYASPLDAWVGDDNFVGHFVRRFSQKNMHVKMSFGPIIPPSDWETMRDQTEDWVRQETLRLRAQFNDVPVLAVSPKASTALKPSVAG